MKITKKISPCFAGPSDTYPPLKKGGWGYFLLFFLFFFFSFGTRISFAEDIRVNLSADAESITLEDELHVTVALEGAKGGSEPSFPAMTGFKIIGSGSSTSVQIINGSMSISKQYSYVLIPQDEGTYNLGPVSIFVDGKEYASNSLSIKVGRPQLGAPPQAGGVPNPNLNQQNQNAPVGDAYGENKPFWITAEVTNQSPYINEQIIYRFRFYTSINVGQAALTLPDFKEFLVDELVPEKKYYETINNQRYVVSEKLLSLIPIKTGDLKIGETNLHVEIPDNSMGSFFNDPFFSIGKSRSKNTKALPIQLHVLPLPEPAPENFTNLVGHFEMETSLTPLQIKEGESATFTATLKGSGNIKDAVLPKNANFGAFKVYEDKPVADTVKTEQGLTGTKVFKMALVPSETGVIKVKGLTFSYFDPEKKEYITLAGPDYSMDVSSQGKENIVSTFTDDGSKITGNNKKIPEAPIFKRVTDNSTNFIVPVKLYWLFLLLPPILYALIVVIRKFVIKEEGASNRQKKAFKIFERDFAKAKKDASIIALSLAVKNYTGTLASSQTGKSLSTVEMEAIYSSLNIGPDLNREIVTLLKNIEAFLYGGSALGVGILFDQTKNVILKIHKAL